MDDVFGTHTARLHTIKRIAEAALRDDPFGCQAR